MLIKANLVALPMFSMTWNRSCTSKLPNPPATTNSCAAGPQNDPYLLGRATGLRRYLADKAALRPNFPTIANNLIFYTLTYNN
jgi:hypothetical protein